MSINREIGQRLAGVRELFEPNAAAFAESLGIPEEKLLAYEAGVKDIPVSLLHNVSLRYGVSMTELMTGETAKLRQYCVVRRGKGVSVSRREAYDYRNLAYNFAGREMEPFVITFQPEEDTLHLTTHSGQEFHYCLEGAFAIQIGEHRITLGEGDSVYFDSSYPHGMQALGGRAARSLAVITM